MSNLVGPGERRQRTHGYVIYRYERCCWYVFMQELAKKALLIDVVVLTGPELAAAVTNAGGLGVIGGLGYTPKILRQQVGFFS